MQWIPHVGLTSGYLKLCKMCFDEIFVPVLLARFWLTGSTDISNAQWTVQGLKFIAIELMGCKHN